MLHLTPAWLHRIALRMVYALRHRYRRLARPDLKGCTIIATDLEGRLMLVRHTYGPDNWALPGGGIGRGEDPAEAAQRELREETGCVARAVTLVDTIDLREVREARFFPTHSLPEPLSQLARRRIDAWRKA